MIELTWRPALDPAVVEEVRALLAAATAADGTAPVSEQVLLALPGDGSAAVNVLARDADGVLAGFAHLDLGDPPTAELAVHPRYRRRGVGTGLVTALLRRVDAGGSPGRLDVWAHGDHPGAAALAARLGLRRARELWRMRRDLLGPLPAPVLAAGVRLRPFVVGADEAEFLRVNNAAFDWHPEQGGWDLAQLRQREAQPWFDPAGFLLAVDERDRVLGFHWTKVHPGAAEPAAVRPAAAERPEPAAGPGAGQAAARPAVAAGEAIGEVYVLGVDPAARGSRLGAALTMAGLRHLRERGLGRVMLYVEGDNHAAIRVYEDLGFARFDTDVCYRH